MGLSVEERERVMCIEDKTAVTLLRQMYQKKARDGEGLFFNVDDQPSDSSDEPCFSRINRLIHLAAYPDFLLRADRQLGMKFPRSVLLSSVLHILSIMRDD